MKSVQTLGVVVDGDKILLGMKKRGFGEGKWNGFGGKVKEGETIEDALKRSAESESNKITVAVKGDTVTLSGQVKSFSESEDAGMAAWMAPGIVTVENNIKIQH